MNILLKKLRLYVFACILFFNLTLISARGGCHGGHFGASIHIGGPVCRPCYSGWGWGWPYYDDYYYPAGAGFVAGTVAGAAIASSNRPSQPPEDPKEVFERRKKKAAIEEHDRVEREIKKLEKKISKEEKKLKKEQKRKHVKAVEATESKRAGLLEKLKSKKDLLKKLSEKIRNNGYDDTEDDDDDDDDDGEEE